MSRFELPKDVKDLMERQQYRLVGNHSAVKICHWTKQSLRDKGVCYKQLFYGIECHRCLQMTPVSAWCPNRCLYCWRATDRTISDEMKEIKPEDIDDPETVLDSCIEAQRELLMGFKGFEGTNMKKWKEAQDPNQVAISLTGEPTLYPKLSDFVDLCRKRGMTTFLVTNGMYPEHLESMSKPYQLYLSLDAPNKEVYKKLDIPQLKDFWERFERTIDLMPTLDTRRVVRLTLVKDWNMYGKDDEYVKQYARLIERADPKYIEAKAYMHVGFSRQRLPIEAMPRHNEVMEFAEKLRAELPDYKIAGEQVPSRVVLLEKE